MVKGTCSAEGCDTPAKVRDLCQPHYYRWWKGTRTWVCSITDCTTLAMARGWCPMHWSRWRYNGHPLVVRIDRRSDWTIRFWAKVDKTHPSGCWLWTAGRTANGYGQFTNKGTLLAHRVAFELLVGPIPDGCVVDHLCRVRLCVRGEHLEAVTFAENSQRGGIPIAPKIHCPQGHPYDEANTYIRPDGRGRDCRICRNDRQRLRRPPLPRPARR
jgi:hypothetical protein